MSDLADDSDARIELTIRAGIEQARRSTVTLKPNGHCYYCEEPVSYLFCGAECRDAHEHEQAAKRRSGRL